MKIKYYPEEDVLDLKINNAPYDHAEMQDNFVIHFTKDKRPVRIEVLQASSFLKEQAKALPVQIKERYFLTRSL